MRRIVLHVGYPKAASTTLQNGLFINLHQDNKINFIGRAWESGNYGGYDNRDDYKVWLKNVIQTASLDENDLKAEIQRQNCFKEMSDDKVNVYSEGLFMTNEDHETEIMMPRVLRELFSAEAFDAEILIVVRSQIKLLMSYYVQNYPKIKKKTFRKFLDQCVDENWTGRYKIFNYNEIIQKYSDHFGKEKINILLFEDMVQDLETFSRSISNVIKVDRDFIFEQLSGKHFNKTQDRSGTKVVRKINPTSFRGIIKRINRKFFPNIQGVGDINVPPLTDEEKSIILDSFRDDNMKLAEAFGLDKKAMQAYGYF